MSSALSALLSPESFMWSSAPLSSISAPFLGVTCYLMVIYTLQWRVATRGPLIPTATVNTMFAYHNLLLCALSAIMFVGTASAVIHRTIQQHDWKWIVCEDVHGESVGTLWFWSYVYYLSKYYELLDSVFLALKGSLQGWGGLQVYHHSVVLFMAWFWVHYRQSLQFAGLLFNTAVHIVMYYYFYRRSLGQTPKWRKHVTTFQIIQFMTSIVLLFPNLYYHFNSVRGCGGESALYFNLVFNVTLLFEFVSLFKKPDKVKATSVSASASANTATATAIAAPTKLDTNTNTAQLNTSNNNNNPAPPSPAKHHYNLRQRRPSSS